MPQLRTIKPSSTEAFHISKLRCWSHGRRGCMPFFFREKWVLVKLSGSKNEWKQVVSSCFIYGFVWNWRICIPIPVIFFWGGTWWLTNGFRGNTLFHPEEPIDFSLSVSTISGMMMANGLGFLDSYEGNRLLFKGDGPCGQQKPQLEILQWPWPLDPAWSKSPAGPIWTEKNLGAAVMFVAHSGSWVLSLAAAVSWWSLVFMAKISCCFWPLHWGWCLSTWKRQKLDGGFNMFNDPFWVRGSLVHNDPCGQCIPCMGGMDSIHHTAFNVQGRALAARCLVTAVSLVTWSSYSPWAMGVSRSCHFKSLGFLVFCRPQIWCWTCGPWKFMHD